MVILLTKNKLTVSLKKIVFTRTINHANGHSCTQRLPRERQSLAQADVYFDLPYWQTAWQDLKTAPWRWTCPHLSLARHIKATRTGLLILELIFTTTKWSKYVFILQEEKKNQTNKQKTTLNWGNSNERVYEPSPQCPLCPSRARPLLQACSQTGDSVHLWLVENITQPALVPREKHCWCVQPYPFHSSPYTSQSSLLALCSRQAFQSHSKPQNHLEHIF